MKRGRDSKKLVWRYPQYCLEKWNLVHTFYNGLGEETKAHFDASLGGVFMNQHEFDAYDKLEMMPMNNFNCPKGIGSSKKMIGVCELDQYTTLSAHDSMSRKLDMLTVGVNAVQKHVNIPFVDALEQMPSYDKFMKEILSNKRMLEDYEIVAWT